MKEKAIAKINSVLSLVTKNRDGEIKHTRKKAQIGLKKNCAQQRIHERGRSMKAASQARRRVPAPVFCSGGGGGRS